jgi:hypothetical protein
MNLLCIVYAHWHTVLWQQRIVHTYNNKALSKCTSTKPYLMHVEPPESCSLVYIVYVEDTYHCH